MSTTYSSSSYSEAESLLLGLASKWDPKEGSQLVFRLLELTGESILSRCEAISKDIESLQQSTLSTTSHLNNTINDLYLASNDQFIQNTVAEEDDPLMDVGILSFGRSNISSETCIPTDDPKDVLASGLEFLSNLRASSSDKPSIPGFLRYSSRSLPFIIGSQEFQADDFIGLKNVESFSSKSEDPSLNPSSFIPPPPPLPPPSILSSSNKGPDIPSESVSHASSSSAFSSRGDSSLKGGDSSPNPIHSEESSNLMNALCSEIRSRRKTSPSSGLMEDVRKKSEEAKSLESSTSGMFSVPKRVEDHKRENDKCKEVKEVLSSNIKPFDVTEESWNREAAEKLYLKVDENRVKSIFSSSDEENEEDNQKSNSFPSTKSNPSHNISEEGHQSRVNSRNIHSALHKELLARVNNDSTKSVKQEPIKASRKVSSIEKPLTSQGHKSLSIFDESEDEDSLFNDIKKPNSHSSILSRKFDRSKSSTPKDLTPKPTTATQKKETEATNGLKSKAKSLFDDSSEDEDSLFKPSNNSSLGASDNNFSKAIVSNLDVSRDKKKVTKGVRPKLFDSDEEDLFSSKKPTHQNISTKVPILFPTTADKFPGVESPLQIPIQKNKTLSDSEDEENIFKTAPKKKSSIKSNILLFDDSDDNSDFFNDIVPKKSDNDKTSDCLKDHGGAVKDGSPLPIIVIETQSPLKKDCGASSICMETEANEKEKKLDDKDASGHSQVSLVIEEKFSSKASLSLDESNDKVPQEPEKELAMDLKEGPSKSEVKKQTLVKQLSLQMHNQLSEAMRKRNVSASSHSDCFSPPHGDTPSNLLVGLTKSRPRISSNRRRPTRKRSVTPENSSDFYFPSHSEDPSGTVSSLRKDPLEESVAKEHPDKQVKALADVAKCSKSAHLKIFDSSTDEEDDIFT